MPARNVVVIGSAHPLRGGLAAYNERLAHEFQRQGAEVLIYSFRLQYPSVFFPGKTQFTKEPPPEDLTILSRINSVNPVNWIRVGNEIRNMKPDLVIVKFWMPFFAPCLGTLCRIIRKNSHTKVISILDNLIPHERRPGDRLLASFFIRSVDGFIAMSKSVLQDLEQFDRSKPNVFIPHPLYDHFGQKVSKDEAKQQLGLETDGNYLLFFGFIRDYKGLDLLLNAFADPRIRELNLKLLVAGEFYSNPDPYFRIIREQNLDNRIIVRNDFIPDSMVRYYFCAADLVVQPYKSATQSGVTQIAYHFEKPMIITNVGGLAEFVPHGKAGYVVEPDPSRIADAIVSFYREKKEEEFAARAAVEKKKYTWEAMAGAIDSLVNRMTNDMNDE